MTQDIASDIQLMPCHATILRRSLACAISVRDGGLTHCVRFNLGRWSCDCVSFRSIGACRHIEEALKLVRWAKSRSA
jgi:hypothetical protein